MTECERLLFATTIAKMLQSFESLSWLMMVWNGLHTGPAMRPADGFMMADRQLVAPATYAT